MHKTNTYEYIQAYASVFTSVDTKNAKETMFMPYQKKSVNVKLKGELIHISNWKR